MPLRMNRPDRQITIESPVWGTNEYNEPVIIRWDTLATVWANELWMRGDEIIASEQDGAVIVKRWRTRWRDDIAVEQRILGDDGRYYYIRAVEEIQRRRWVLLHAQYVEGKDTS